jgi:hypothetical protein
MKGQKTGGRRAGTMNHATRDIREAARVYTPQALATLAKVMLTGKTEQARVMAADKLLDRGHGKPTQINELTGPGGGPIRVLSETERAAKIASLLQGAVKRKGSGT